MMNTEDAVLHLRGDPQWKNLVRDAYLGEDVLEAAERFSHSGEFLEVVELLGRKLADATILDVGAGTGIASYAFAQKGAHLVYALEPDPSHVVGRGVIHHLCADLPVETLDAVGEGIPLADEQVDIVYGRQVLHHIRDLPAALAECARVLKRGGLFLACREHVVKDEEELRTFLERHPVHRLAGGEHAYSLDQYICAITGANLKMIQVFSPWQSLVNAFPVVQTTEELRRKYPRSLLQRRFGTLGRLVGGLPGIRHALWRRLTKPAPGRIFTFLAQKT